MKRQKPRRSVSEDEADVWRQATTGAKPLSNRARTPYLTRPAPDPAAVRQHLAETAARPLETDYLAPTLKPAPEKHLDRAQLTRLKRGRLPTRGKARPAWHDRQRSRAQSPQFPPREPANGPPGRAGYYRART